MANDYISRDYAAENMENFPWDTERDKNAAIHLVRELVPAADVRSVVSAEWERPKGSTPRSWIFVCSKCGDRAYFPVPKYFPKGCGYSFCPNCGADMREAGK